MEQRVQPSNNVRVATALLITPVPMGPADILRRDKYNCYCQVPKISYGLLATLVCRLRLGQSACPLRAS